MPIYDMKIDAETRRGSAMGIGYHTNGDAEVARVVHFGFGDIMIAPASEQGNPHVNHLVFEQKEPRPIGTLSSEFTGIPTQPPVKFFFEKVESIDVVIERLQTLREEFIATGDKD